MSEHVHLTPESAKALVDSGAKKTMEEILNDVMVYKGCDPCLLMLKHVTLPTVVEAFKRMPDEASKFADQCVKTFNRHEAQQN